MLQSRYMLECKGQIGSLKTSPTFQREPLVLDFKQPVCYLYTLGASEDSHDVSSKASFSLVSCSLCPGAPPHWGCPPLSTSSECLGLGRTQVWPHRLSFIQQMWAEHRSPVGVSSVDDFLNFSQSEVHLIVEETGRKPELFPFLLPSLLFHSDFLQLVSPSLFPVPLLHRRKNSF